MLVDATARLFTRLYPWGLLVTMALCSAFLGSDLPSSSRHAKVGSYVAAGAVTEMGCTRALAAPNGSEHWYVGEVKVNGIVLTKDLDYTVVDEPSGKKVVAFLARPASGDRVEIRGPTLEPGQFEGTLRFF